MKRLNSDTLVRDFVAAAFCLIMAFALLMICSGCSEDAGQSPLAHEGGYTEEQASLENIKVVAFARQFESAGDASEFRLVSSVAPGSIVRMSELDSVDFSATSVVYYSRSKDSTGVFNFDSVSLKSPYVKLELSPSACGMEGEELKWTGGCEVCGIGVSCRKYEAYSLIADLRKSKNVGINVVTTVVSKRLLKLISQGMDFDEAERQAESEMLNALGIYGVPYRFDKAMSDENRTEILFADFLSEMFSYKVDFKSASDVAYIFGEDGSLNANVSLKKFLINKIIGLFNVGWRDESLKESLRDIASNFTASLYGLSQCTAENESQITVFPYADYKNIDFVCEKGAWSYLVHYVVPDSVGAVWGQMTDSRDGKKYNTVTYNIGGVERTWLAENLKYNSTDGIYFWNEAMNLPDSIALVSYEECLEENSYTACDRLQIEKSDFIYENLWRVTDSVKATGKNYQGICPDGWHLPDGNEWKQLRDYVTEKLNIKLLENEDVMAMAGFGEVGADKGVMYAVKIDSAFSETLGRNYGSTVMEIYVKGSTWFYASLEDKSWNIMKHHEFVDDKMQLYVRCVKD